MNENFNDINAICVKQKEYDKLDQRALYLDSTGTVALTGSIEYNIIIKHMA